MSSFEERMKRWQSQIDAEQQRLNEAVISHYAANGYSDAEIRQAAAALRNASATPMANTYGQLATTPGIAERMRLRKQFDEWHDSRR